MKRNFLAFTWVVVTVFLLGGNVWGQSLVFEENIGSTTGTKTIINNTFQNTGILNYDGDADTRSTTPSTGYTGASGGRNVWFTSTNKYFEISGINTLSFSSLALSFGVLSATANNILKVEYSTDGVNYAALSVDASIPSNTWTLKNTTGTIPSVANLKLKFTSVSGSSFRLDDILLSGILSTGPTLATGPTSLTGFSYAFLNGPSAYQSFVLSGNNLDGTDVELLTGDYELSTDNLSFSDYILLSSYSGVSTSIYVRLKAGLTLGNYIEQVLIAGGGATDIDVDLSGEVFQTYDVIFDANGGVGSMSNQTIISGATENLSTNTFTRTGYVFDGWATSASGAVAYADGATYTMGTANVTIFAKWSVFVGPCIDESFEAGLPTSYNSSETSQSLSSGSWVVRSAGGSTGSTAGSSSVQIRSQSNSYVISPTSTSTYSSFTLNAQGTTSSPELDVYYSTNDGVTWILFNSYSLSGSTTAITGTLISASSLINKLKFQRSSGTIYLDEIKIFCAPSSPTLTASPTSLIGLDYTVGSGPSIAKIFDLSGTNLDNSNVILTPTNTNFELSKDGSVYSNILTYSTYNGSSTTVYVRLKAGLTVANYTGQISIAGGGAASINVAIGGSVNAIIPPSITSAATQSVIYGSSTIYSIIASQSPTSYGSTGLPTGLSINTTTGVISGTPTVNVGLFTSTITATNAGGTDSKTLTWTITKKNLTVTGLSASNRIYDGTVTASLFGTGTLNGIVFSDNVTLSGTPSSTFVNKNVGTGKAVTVAGYTLSGTKSGNYTLTQPAGLTANITAKGLTVSGATANNKVYDGNTTATISGGTLSGVISLDVVTLSGGGTFANANVGNAKAVTASLTLGGADAGNYTLTQPAGLTANITPATPIFTTSTININLGGTYALPGANISSTSPVAFSYSISSGGNATLSGAIIYGDVVGTEILTVTQAAGGNYSSASTTVSIDVSSFLYISGDVRPLNVGAGLSYNSGWEQYDGTSWTNRSSSPESVKPTGRIIIDKLNIDGSGNVVNSYNDIIVKSGGSLILNDNTGTLVNFINAGKTLEIQDGGKVTLNGQIQLSSTANLIVRSGGVLEINSTSIDNSHTFWNGKENFEGGSYVVIKDWNWSASTSDMPLLRGSSSQVLNNTNGYKFGNLTIETDVGDNWTLVPGNSYGSLKLCENNLEISNTSTVNFITGTSNNTSGYTINGDFIIYDGWFNFGTTFTGNTSFVNHYVINGDFICQSNDKLKIHEIVNGNSSSSGSLTVLGDFEIGSQVPNFTNHGTKKIILKGGTAGSSKYIDIGTSVLYIPIEIEDGYREFKNYDLEFGNNSSMLVKSGASLNFGFNSSGDALNVISTGTGSGNSFTAQAQSILYLTSPDGITSSTTVGNVQTTTRIFATASPYADYHYVGNANQNTGTALPTNVRNLTNNNDVSANNLTLSQSLTVANTLTMLNGNIQTGTNLLELGQSTSTKGTLSRTSGYVVGKMRRWFNGTNSGDASGLFPMGYDDGGLKNRNVKVEFTNVPTGGHLTVEYINSPMHPAGDYTGLPILIANNNGATFDVASTEDQGYWEIENLNLTDGLYKMSLTGEGYNTIGTLNNLSLLKRVGSGNWLTPGTHLAASGTLTAPIVSRSGMTGWSNFGFGGGPNNPLPVTLTSFEVLCSESEKHISINWGTASETNSSHFLVEKSRDMINWTVVSERKAAGNSSQNINYKEMDTNPWNGITYYRLKQFDYNGDMEVFNVISVSCAIGENNIIVYPNPSKGEFTLEINWNQKAVETQLQIMAITGKVVHLQDLKIEEGVKQIYFNELNLQSGTYLIVFKGIEMKPLRIVVNN